MIRPRTVVVAHVAAHVVALVGVARWAALRVTDGAGEPWGLAAAVLAVWIAFVRRRESTVGAAGVAAGASAEPSDLAAPDLRLPSVLLFVYAVCALAAAPLLAAAVGVTSLVALHAALRGRRLPEPALLGLALAALPDVQSLQFFVGWPLRRFVAETAAPALRAVGIDATARGTFLETGGSAVAVDAPCSGVWMLWGGVVLALALAAIRGLGWRRTLCTVAAVPPVVFVANVLRTVSLTMVEADPRAPAAAHSAIGVVTFALAALAIAWVARRLRDDRPAGASTCAA